MSIPGINVQRMYDVLSQEQGLCAGSLQNGARCVFGALLAAEGFTPEELRGMQSSLVVPIMRRCDGVYTLRRSAPEWRARTVLLKRYGMTDCDIRDGMKMNDHMESLRTDEITNEERLAVILTTLEGAMECWPNE